VLHLSRSLAEELHVRGIYILYFAWEDQSEKVHWIVYKVVINCITVLYEPYGTVMCLIGNLEHCYALN